VPVPDVTHISHTAISA